MKYTASSYDPCEICKTNAAVIEYHLGRGQTADLCEHCEARLEEGFWDEVKAFVRHAVERLRRILIIIGRAR